MVNITASGSRAQLVVSNPQPYKMIRENIWQRTDPGTLWHPGVQEHGCEGSGGGAVGSTENRSPHPLSPQTPRYALYFGINLSHTHTEPQRI